jgi:hypothetical protein
MKNEGNFQELNIDMYSLLKKYDEEWLRSLDSDFLEKMIDGFLTEVENNIIKNELRKRKLKKLK